MSNEQDSSDACICDTIEEALTMIRAKYPDAILWGLNHCGQEDTYFQKGHTVLIGDGTTELPSDTKGSP